MASSAEVERGKYIVIEGLDGSGKGTQVERLVDYLSHRRRVITTMEPGGTPIGDLMRAAIKDVGIARSPKSNVDMLTISRREGAQQIIRPRLQDGIDVVTDRSHYSTFAYQGFGEGVNLDYIRKRSKDALDELFTPDLAVVLRVPFDELMRRMEARGGAEKDYFESKGIKYFRRVIDGYDWVVSEFGAVPIDGNMSPDHVQNRIRNLCRERLGI